MQRDNIKIRQKSEHSFEASVTLDGKRIYKNAKTPSEAKAKLKELIEKSKKGEVINQTAKLCIAMESYLKNVKQAKVKATTYDRAESIFTYHIKDEKLGRMQIGNITSQDIQEHLLSQCKLGLSVSSIKKIYKNLSRAYTLLKIYYTYLVTKCLIAFDKNHFSSSSSLSQLSADASDGIRQSPRGERVTEPTLGPSGRQERLNCCEKKRFIKTFSQCLIVSLS